MGKHPNDAQREALAKIAGLEAKEAGASPEEIKAAEAAAIEELPDSGQTMSPKDLRDVVRELRAVRLALARPHLVMLAAVFAAGNEEGDFDDAIWNAESLLRYWDDLQRRRREEAQGGGGDE